MVWCSLLIELVFGYLQGCKVLYQALFHRPPSPDLLSRRSCIASNSIIIFRKRCWVDSLRKISVYWNMKNNSTRCKYVVSISPDSITPKSTTQIMSLTFVVCVADFCDLHLRTLSPTILVHCNGLNSIRVTQTGLSWTCHGLCRKYLDMLRWSVSATFVICVHDFPHGEVSVKVGVMEFGLYSMCWR